MSTNLLYPRIHIANAPLNEANSNKTKLTKLNNMEQLTGAAIRSKRRAFDLSQTDVSIQMGLKNCSYLSHIESGKRGVSESYAKLIYKAIDKAYKAKQKQLKTK